MHRWLFLYTCFKIKRIIIKSLVIEIIKDVINKGVDIKEMSGDDDTTGFQRAQKVHKIKC